MCSNKPYGSKARFFPVTYGSLNFDENCHNPKNHKTPQIIDLCNEWRVFVLLEMRTRYFHLTDFKRRENGFQVNPHLKAGVHLKAVYTPLKIGSTEISRSRFKQYKNPLLITQINALGCFVNFWVIFRFIWEEIVFLKRVVKLREIRNIEDSVKF